MQAIHVGFAEEGPCLPGGGLHGLGFGGGETDRLLAEHMLSGPCGLHRPLGMGRMRRRDVDRVNVRVRQQGVVAVQDACSRKLVRQPRFLPDCVFRSSSTRPVLDCATPAKKSPAILPGPRMPQRSFSVSFMSFFPNVMPPANPAALIKKAGSRRSRSLRARARPDRFAAIKKICPRRNLGDGDGLVRVVLHEERRRSPFMRIVTSTPSGRSAISSSTPASGKTLQTARPSDQA